ncbi:MULTISPECIES: cobalamin biosynthesis protein [Methylococcus]|jgi:cobalt-precorrin 5A hydrolase|uniref:Cobalt-precorrin 5A hydrolase n=1 Tax=Methylococcus capsulatus TaxID=414 RepID=A0AA35V563_METCP|nr:cobalamin biosynthesis protein [Methylococcus capsulatus]CAI8840266.1 cobalt-precorrin 5A hydrolase [Methylococcus capsulatus]
MTRFILDTGEPWNPLLLGEGRVRATALNVSTTSSQTLGAETLTPTGFAPVATLSPRGEGLGSATLRVILGLGCDRGAAPETLQTAVDEALALAGLNGDAVAGLATIDRKNDEDAILQLAARHGWPLRFYTAEELARVPVPNPSETVRRYMGTPAVAEAAALLAARGGIGDLLLEKHKYRGADGKNATVSIARLNDE